MKIAAPTWNEEFELASYSVSDIRDYFEYHKKHETVTNISPIRIYANKMENRIVFKKKTAYYLEILRIYKNPYSCLLKNAR